MPLTLVISTILASGLATFIVVFTVFGHRCSDKAEKFDERAEELNKIRIGMRSDTTLPALDKLWQFLVEANKKMNQRDQSMGVTLLFYDVERRDLLNKLINDIEQTFENSRKVGEVLDSLRSAYGQLGRALYVLVAIVGLGGYGLLILDLGFAFLESELWFALLCDLLVVIIILCFEAILAKSRMIHSNQKVYQKARKQYLIDEVRIKE